MKILLTGYKGFIGSHMLARLDADGHEVSLHEWGDAFPSVIGQDWVIHVGAISSTAERDVDKVLTQNFDFSRQLYDASRTAGVNFQYASSASVYGLESSFKENAAVDPRTPYAWSKYLFERYVRDNPSSSIVQGFRYFNVYGPEGEEHKGNQASPFAKFKHQAETLGKIQVFEGSERYRRDFIHVSEVVDTHVGFLSNTNSGLWNLGTGRTMSFMDVAKSFNVPVEIVSMPDNLKDSYQKYTCADMTLINMQRWQRGPMQESAKL